MGAGDAVIGVNLVSDSLPALDRLTRMLDEVIQRFDIPTQSCVLTHVTNTVKLIERGAPVDLVFQSIGGTEKTNLSFGVTPELLDEAHAAAQSLKRGTVGRNVMYFETGQGSALSANANFGVDQQTCEARAYAPGAGDTSRCWSNTVSRFHRPRVPVRRQADHRRRRARRPFLRQAAGPADGLRWSADTNHAEADQDDMDTLLVMLGSAGLNFVMGVPGADDVMLNYQSTSFHDALFLRSTLGLARAPEFEAWLQRMHGSPTTRATCCPRPPCPNSPP